MEITIISRPESLKKTHPGLRLMLCAILLVLAVAMLFAFKNPNERDAKKERQLKELSVEAKTKVPNQRMAGAGTSTQGREEMEWEACGVDDDELAILIPGLP